MTTTRTYGRIELAQCYFPNLTPAAAWRKLRSWIHLCQPLRDELQRRGYDEHLRTFTPAQVDAITYWLGEP